MIRRAQFNKYVIGVVALLAVIAGYIIVTSFASAPPAWSFSSSGLVGSGFQNVVAYSPFPNSAGKYPVLDGADVSGVSYSTNDGQNWIPGNVGLGQNHVAALLWSDKVAGKVYVATDSAIFLSTNFGQSWSKQSQNDANQNPYVDFDGNGDYHLPYPAAKDAAEHPRPTGNLLAQDNSGSTHYLYAATSSKGVMRSTDDGQTWQSMGLVGDHLRTIALDPSDHNKLYVGDAFNGLQVNTNATSSTGFSRVPNSPDDPEEVAYVNGQMYVAANIDGLFRYDGTSWHSLNTSAVNTNTSRWESITGMVDSKGNTILYAGCSNPVGGVNTLRSADGGATWASITTGSNVSLSNVDYGQSVNWWAYANSYLSFTGTNFVDAMIAISPTNPDSLLLAGRGGMKHLTISTSGSSNSYAWAPANNGLMVTVNNMVVTDPNAPNRVYDASMDYRLVASTDHGKTFNGNVAPPIPKSAGDLSTGRYISLDESGPTGTVSPVYEAVSMRGMKTGTGMIFSNPDPLGSGSWTDEQLPAAATNDPLVLGVGNDSSGNRIILTSITNQGLWRKVGNCASSPNSCWSEETGTAPFSGGGYGTIAWVPRSSTVYAVDSVGVWRSDSAGAQGSWNKLATSNAGYNNINALALDPTDSHVVYVSDASGVSRIDGADGKSATSKDPLLSATGAGPIATDSNGTLFYAERNNTAGGSTAKLMVAKNSSSGSPTFNPSGDSFFADNR